MDTHHRLFFEWQAEANRLADAAARRVQGLPCCERDDLRQVAALALLRLCQRLDSTRDAGPFVRITISGALRQHIRDRGRLVRVSRRAHESGEHPLGHASLDVAEPGCGPLADRLAAPEQDEPGDPLALEMLDTLPAGQAAAIRLCILQGMTLRAAADATNAKHPMAVSREITRGLKSLRKHITTQRSFNQ